MIYAVISGLIDGKMILAIGRTGHAHYVSRADRPHLFWFAVVYNTAAIALVGYLAIAEILYARKLGKMGQGAEAV